MVEALLERDRSGDNRVRVLCSDLLDVHATLRGDDKNRPIGCAVVEDGDVVFVAGVTALRKHDLIYTSSHRSRRDGRSTYSIADAAGRTGLLGDEF